jgi:hypothetical protein
MGSHLRGSSILYLTLCLPLL